MKRTMNVGVTVIQGRIPSKRLERYTIIVSTPGMFNWVADVAKAYANDVREGQRNAVTRAIWR